MKNILITGVNGFVGKHAAREFHSRGFGIAGLGYNEPPHPEISDLLSSYYECDLTDPDDIGSVSFTDVSAVLNLAGLANVGDSFENTELYKKVNVAVMENLGKEILKQSAGTRIVAVSTGAVYDSSDQLPLTESSRVADTGSPYALSKLMMEEATKALNKQGLDCVIVRPFNHSGPGQLGGFLIPDIYKKMAALRSSGKTVLKVGNLKTSRDYTDVRDIVRAYADLVEHPELKFDTYNVCSGISRSGNEIVELLAKYTGLTSELTVEVDQSLVRPDDPMDIRGSYSRLQKDVGWNPSIPLAKTIEDFVAYQAGR